MLLFRNSAICKDDFTRFSYLFAFRIENPSDKKCIGPLLRTITLHIYNTVKKSVDSGNEEHKIILMPTNRDVLFFGKFLTLAWLSASIFCWLALIV